MDPFMKRMVGPLGLKIHSLEVFLNRVLHPMVYGEHFLHLHFYPLELTLGLTAMASRVTSRIWWPNNLAFTKCCRNPLSPMIRMSYGVVDNWMLKNTLSVFFTKLLKIFNFLRSNLNFPFSISRNLTISGMFEYQAQYFSAYNFLKKLMDAFENWENNRYSIDVATEAPTEN